MSTEIEAEESSKSEAWRENVIAEVLLNIVK